MRKLPLVFALFCLIQAAVAQDYFPKNDGVKEKNTNYTALTNATIYVTHDQVIKKGTLLIQDGKVVATGSNVNIPENTVTVDLQGKFIYPSFIDPYTGFGVDLPKRAERDGRSAQYEPSREGFYWNDHIMPENSAIGKFEYDKMKAKEYREAGFGVVNTHIADGIARGTGAVIALNDEGGDAQRILEDESGQFFSFERSIASNQSYPSSLMGSMALLRQMYWDAEWYAKGNVDTKDRSLEALLEIKTLPAFFEAGDKGNALRADTIGDRFNTNYIIVGGGNEYENIDEIKATQARFILPVDFPDAYDVTDPYAAKYIALEDMRAWNQAPGNPKALSDKGIPFALTTHKLKKPTEFGEKLQKALTYGLDKTKALEALTTVPAAYLNMSEEIGSLQNGRYANFLVTSGDVFDKNTTLYENWVQGEKHVINSLDQRDLNGKYKLAFSGQTYDLEISGGAAKPKSKVSKGEDELKSTMTYSENWMSLKFSDEKSGKTWRATALVPAKGKSISGRIVLPDGDESSFTATRSGDLTSEDEKETEKDSKPEVVSITYPNVGYGFNEKPKQTDMLFKNATVWTSEDAGVLENTDVLVRDGKIAKIGKDLNAGRAEVIDATGKHLTAGVIDEHSHIAALSINESGQNSSAEVSIEDVVDPEDINIYRNLGGGVTSIQILHGSANPIGGRSAIIKLKWGEDAEELIYDNSPKFIKFALGENVKQSNWQSFNRFPQTRMGVEQVFVNYFNRAKAYDAKKKSGEPYRYDEEMEVLAEILNGERFISSHSYVQSEINMLMKVAEQFGFRINTFTHILEGYKVADKMKEHGVGASTFSDWWAYKYEVNDAIPYNAAIMANQGLTVAINSDDREMSRRLNQEAAKTVKYGGMSEEEAWKMVTINPAKLLHIDDRVGSIAEGKDADLVLWTDHPLSVAAKAEKTIIEGTVFFDLETDRAKRDAIQAERSKLIGMMLDEKNGGAKTRAPEGKDRIDFECETIN
ncbi:amidohydrolase family protein [Zeaxanthinibacter sp. PT1]|uniref:amidohydrolase family protein n=1 Tax=Zeaxanthinibacter TaxID=561554 RepID=UPI00234A649B|nr:amidohydrolase family protein [Zeaxanthinibacter sp. PT1]MDC6350912.1 amidohydrolase family protein [Zeaxanthinibacter sp. PT1]